MPLLRLTFQKANVFNVCLVISEIILSQRIRRHRRIPIGYTGNLFPEEAHRALECHVGNHALFARVLVRQDMHLAHSLMNEVESCLLVRTFQQLGDAVKLFQNLRSPSMRFSAVVILTCVSSSASLNPASRSYRSSRRLCRS